jgi:hypothetical protein
VFLRGHTCLHRRIAATLRQRSSGVPSRTPTCNALVVRRIAHDGSSDHVSVRR